MIDYIDKATNIVANSNPNSAIVFLVDYPIFARRLTIEEKSPETKEYWKIVKAKQLKVGAKCSRIQGSFGGYSMGFNDIKAKANAENLIKKGATIIDLREMI